MYGKDTDKFNQTLLRIKNTQVAFAFVLARSLKDLPLELDDFFDEETVSDLEQYHNKPNAILQLLKDEMVIALKENSLSVYHSLRIDATITALTDSMGKCERIKNTVFPKTYSMFVTFLLYLFVLLLPFGIRDHLGYIEGVIVILVSIPFFLLEKSAIELQDPFKGDPTDTPVLTIAAGIDRDLSQMVKDKNFKPRYSNPDTFYEI